MKRGFCLFLVAVLLAGLVPYAFADETEATETAEASEAATESTEETAETTEPEKDEIADGQLLADSISTCASTVSNVLLFDQASPNYTTVLKSQISVTYQPNGTDAAKTAYIKNLGWHFARYNNTPYEDDPIYCIEPCKNYAASTSGNYMDQDLGVSGSGSSRGSNVWYAMPSSYRQAIALTLLYSKQLWNSNYSVKTTAMANNPNVFTRIATQFLIYEIVTGLRDANTFNRKSSNGYSSGDVFYNAGVANVSGFADKYNSIVSSVQSAMKVPSFTGRSSGSAPTITMSGSQVSVKDSNGVLGNFSFANGNGASFSKSGNTLTITKTGTISPSTVFSATRSLPSAENSTVSIYYSASSTYQTCVKLEYGKNALDQWLNKEQGLGCFTKSTNTGDEISGWHITVYADEACTQELHTLITGQDGTVCIYLEPGIYWVKETGSENARDDYWKMDDSVKQLVIRAHEKTILEFVNNYSGRIAIRKSVEPKGTLEDWKFKITDADGKKVSGSPLTTDKDGKILTGNLTPGDYTVEEVLPADSLYTGEAPKTVTVVAGKTAEVSFLNKLRAGKITIRKVDTKDEPLAGATFLLEGSEDGNLWYPIIPGSNGICILGERSEENLTAASKTSGEDGLLTWENLPITLQYRITETKAPEGYTLLKDYAFVGTLPADNIEMELRVVNGEAFTLSKTGATGLTVLPLAVIFCFSICAETILYLRKREI